MNNNCTYHILVTFCTCLTVIFCLLNRNCHFGLCQIKCHEIARYVSLYSITLEIAEGELVAVVGNVGSGKSTLLAAVLGELEKRRGKVFVKVTFILYQYLFSHKDLRWMRGL